MELYTAREKDVLLEKIISSHLYYKAYDENERDIIGKFLYPDGYVDIESKLMMPEHYICTATSLGKKFLLKGGYTTIDKEQKRDEVIKALEEGNLRLQNESLEYKKRMRWQNWGSFIVGVISGAIAAIASMLKIFKS